MASEWEWTSTYFNPTGIRFDPDSNTLFIANYAGHNILLAKLAGNPLRAVVQSSIANPGMRSPENVSVRGNRIAVADYDGSSVLMFDRAGILLWRYPLSLAHGIFVADDAVYATGLGSDKLIKLSLDGQLIAKDGASLLYPTDITEIDGRLAVIDANRGSVVTFDHDLKQIDSTGENGPDFNDFHRPYGLAANTRFVMVADTYKSRLVVQNRATRKPAAVIGVSMPIAIGSRPEYGHPPFPYCSAQPAPDALMSRLRDAYGLNPDIKGVVGYQTICLLLNGAMYTSAMTLWDNPKVISRHRPGTPLGFTWQQTFTVDDRDIVLTGAPDNQDIQVFDTKMGVYLLIHLPPGIQVWGKDAAFSEYLENLAHLQVKALNRVIETCGGNVLAAYLLKVADEPESVSADTTLTQLLAWPEASEVIAKWKAGQSVKGAFASWLAKGYPVVVEDAIWLDLMERFPYATTSETYEKCKSTILSSQN